MGEMILDNIYNLFESLSYNDKLQFIVYLNTKYKGLINFALMDDSEKRMWSNHFGDLGKLWKEQKTTKES